MRIIMNHDCIHEKLRKRTPGNSRLQSANGIGTTAFRAVKIIINFVYPS